MIPELVDGNVRANCPGCKGARAMFEYRTNGGTQMSHVDPLPGEEFGGVTYERKMYQFLRCGGCGQGGMAVVLYPNGKNWQSGGVLREFFPISVAHAPLPESVPHGIGQEFREAEQCAAFGAYRAASAMLRSVLEKTLKANGYTTGNLKEKIDRAAKHGVITASRQKRAHEEIRVLGNDVMHDEWREVGADDFRVAHLYAQRILEDFYDDRASVEAVMAAARAANP